MKIRIIRATVVAPVGAEETRIAQPGETVDVDRADAQLLVALNRAQWLKPSDAEAAAADVRGERADVRPAGRSR